MIFPRTIAGLLLLACLTCTALVQGQGAPAQDVYFASQIWTGNQVIPDGAMLVVDGRVRAIGPRAELDIPAGAIRHELGTGVIIPGLVALQTSLAGDDDQDPTLTPEVQAIDGFDFFENRESLWRAGVTSAQIAPGKARLMPGMTGTVQLAGSLADQVLAAQSSLRLILTEAARNPPRIYEPPVGPVSEDRPLEPTRPQVTSLPAALAALRGLLQTAGEDPQASELAAAVNQAIQQGLPLQVSAQTPAEIRGALQLARQHDLQLILVDCQGLEPWLDDLASWKPLVRGVVLSGDQPGKISNPDVDALAQQVAPWKHVRALLDQGIRVAIRPARDQDLEEMLYVAGQFMQGGMTPAETLQAITAAPANMLGLAQEIGTLEIGQRANFVVLNDQPFALQTQPLATYVQGQPVYQAKPEAETIVIRAGQIYASEGHVLDAGSVVVKAGTIRGIGNTVSAPVGAEVHDFGDAVIVPGFVDMGTTLGLGGPLSGTIGLNMRLGEQLDPDDPALAYARSRGVTTVLLRSTAGPASPVTAFKLGPDARVLGDPVAIAFKFGDDTAASLSSNEKLLKAGKAYADSWTKYQQDLADYNQKKAAADKAAAAKAAQEKAEAKSEAAAGDKDQEAEKPAPADKPKETPPADKEPPLDPITGTWEGSLEIERLPEQMRGIQMELTLQDGTVTGTMTLMRNTSPIEGGSYDASTRELKFSITLRDNAVPVQGKLADDGQLEATLDFGRFGPSPLKARRTVDKSVKPAPKPAEGKVPPAPEKKPEGDQPQDESKKKNEAADADQPQAGSAKPQEDAAAKPEELKPPTEPKVNEALEPYRALFAGEIPAMVEASKLPSLAAAVELFAREFKVRTILVGAEDLVRQPDLLGDTEVAVIAGPELMIELEQGQMANLPQVLATEQRVFGFQSAGTTGAGQLPAAVQFAVRQGLARPDALRALTASPARMLGEKFQFGTLAPGHDADLVVLSGPPFEFATQVLAVMIDGVWVYQREE